MQITSGKLKKMSVMTPSGDRIRPTKTGLREAIFNIFGQDLTGYSFCDLCAGSGSVGISAISRGAAPVCFVEKNYVVIRVLRQNLDEVERRLGSLKDVYLSEQSFSIAIERGIAYDLVYFDPPWDFYKKHKLEEYAWQKIVKPGGFLLLEHEKHYPKELTEYLGENNELKFIQTRKYGKARLSIYEYMLEEDSEKIDKETTEDPSEE